MVSPRWRKVLRDLWHNKTRTVLVVLSIAVGVFAVGTIVSTWSMLQHDLAVDYAAIEPSSAIVFAAPFDDALVKQIQRRDDVQSAEGRFNLVVQLRIGSNEWRNLRLEVIDDYAAQQLNKVRSERGAWPPPNRTLLIERASLGLTSASIGDVVELKLPSGKQHALRIAGLAHDLNKVPARFSGTPYGYITFDTLRWLGYGHAYNALHVRVAGNAADNDHVQAVMDAVRTTVEDSGRTVRWMYLPEPGTFAADDILQPMVIVLGVLAVLSLVLSGFLVVNTITALLQQQVRQIGVMKALGARNTQIMCMYLSMVLVFSLLSLAIAVPIGALAAYGITAYLAGLINFNLAGFRVPARALALELAVGIGVPLVAAVYPVVAGVRVTVREAITSYGVGDAFGRGIIDRLLQHIRGLPRPLLLSLRNTFRRKARLLLTLSTLILGGAIFIAIFSVRASLLQTLDEFTAYFNYDVGVDFDGVYNALQTERRALDVPGVVAVETWGGGNARRVRDDGAEGSSFELVAPPADTALLRPTLIAGRWLQPDDNNAIVLDSDVIKNEPDVRVGDEIVLVIEREETRWEVVGIVQTTLSATFIRIGTGYVAYGDLVDVVGAAPLASRVRVQTAQHDPATQRATAAALQAQYYHVGMRTASVRTTSSIKEAIRFQFNVLVVFLSIVATLLAIVGALGLMGTMSMNVHERAREIGVMRAIGASNGAVLQIFMMEGVLIGALSWPFGALLAVPISQALSRVVGTEFAGTPLTYVFATNGALGWLGAVCVLAALASFWPAWNAVRLTVRDVLAYE